MQVFRVNDMTCGHCVSTITKAIKATDKDAKVTIDLTDAIAEAGYTPVSVQATTVVAEPVKTGGCCSRT
jgi:copper chaperone